MLSMIEQRSAPLVVRIVLLTDILDRHVANGWVQAICSTKLVSRPTPKTSSEGLLLVRYVAEVLMQVRMLFLAIA